MITSEWKEAIRNRHDERSLSVILDNKKRLSEEEILWAELIKWRVLTWPEKVDSLKIPFTEIDPPDTIIILLGNQGGNDAFVHSPATICFDLDELRSQYGNPSTSANSNRIDRFFAHEFTHLLHKSWLRKHSLKLRTPFELALWECLTEGIGNYRSLSDKWVQGRGVLTKHVEEVLARLQPVFVERLSGLVHASDEEAARLMEGLSMGEFDQKWGALTVALWLAKEAKGDDHNLQKWVDAGPSGVLLLAEKYLPPELKTKMQNPDKL
jgi:hypothetical protein